MRAILLMALLFGAAVASFLFYQERLAATQQPPPEIVHEDSAPAEVATPLDSGPLLPEELLWQTDPRWVRAEEQGLPLLDEIRALYRWQEEEGGDPLHFRSEKKRLYENLEPIIADLVALKAELARHPGAAGLVEQRIREFSGAISGVLR